VHRKLLDQLSIANRKEKISLLKRLPSFIYPSDDEAAFHSVLVVEGLQTESDPEIILLYLRTIKVLINSYGLLTSCGLHELLIDKIIGQFDQSDLVSVAYDCLCLLPSTKWSLSKDSVNKLYKCVIGSMCNLNFLKRKSAMRLFVTIFHIFQEHLNCTEKELVLLLQKFSHDCDHRVRQAAINLLIQLSKTSERVVYECAINGLGDDYEKVRKEAAFLIL
jgi:hypothetical protein